MRRSFALLLALLLCMTVLAACGSGESSQDASSDEVTVEEQTILDEQGVKAVVKGYGKYESDLLSFDRELLIEVTNNTGKNISFGLSECYINGIGTQTAYKFTVEAGKTDLYPAVFDESKLEAVGITTLEQYEFCIVVEDDESYETLIETDPIILKTSAYQDGGFNYDVDGTVCYDADGIKVVALNKLEESEFFGQYINLYVVNDTDKTIGVGVVDGAVNGKAAELSVGSFAPAGKRCVDILSAEGEEKLEKIESLTLSFAISDWDTGEVIVEKTDPVTITY